MMITVTYNCQMIFFERTSNALVFHGIFKYTHIPVRLIYKFFVSSYHFNDSRFCNSRTESGRERGDRCDASGGGDGGGGTEKNGLRLKLCYRVYRG